MRKHQLRPTLFFGPSSFWIEVLALAGGVVSSWCTLPSSPKAAGGIRRGDRPVSRWLCILPDWRHPRRGIGSGLGGHAPHVIEYVYRRTIQPRPLVLSGSTGVLARHPPLRRLRGRQLGRSDVGCGIGVHAAPGVQS